MSNTAQRPVIFENTNNALNRVWWPATQENSAALQWHINRLAAQGKPISMPVWIRALQFALLLGVACRAVTAAYEGTRTLHLLHSMPSQALDTLRCEATVTLPLLGMTESQFWLLLDYANGATGDAERVAQELGVFGLAIVAA